MNWTYKGEPVQEVERDGDLVLIKTASGVFTVSVEDLEVDSSAGTLSEVNNEDLHP